MAFSLSNGVAARISVMWRKQSGGMAAECESWRRNTWLRKWQ